jgi:GAF domain-containing protein
MDSDITPSFDRLARLAAHVLNAPVALVSLVDADRQFFKSCLGLPEPWASERQAPLTHSFCQHAVASREPLLVDDAREHELLRDNLAIRDMGVIAYAGIPLIDPDGYALGTLCVIDSRPRHWTTHQVQLLSDLAASVVTEIALARGARQRLSG